MRPLIKSAYCLALVMWGMGPIGAATFCVETAEELHSTLTIAAGNSEDDTVQLVQGLYEGNFVYASTEAFSLSVHGGYTVGCASREIAPVNTILDGIDADTVLVFSSNQPANFQIEGLTLQNGNGIDGGGLVVLTSGDLTLVQSTIINNRGGNNAGGVFVAANGVSLSGNTFSGNSGGGVGAVLAIATVVTLTQNTISGNSGDSGSRQTFGGVSLGGDTVTFRGNTVISNMSLFANPGGDAVFLRGEATVIASDNTISNNINESGLGASAPTVVVENNIVTGNTVDAIRVSGETGTVSNNTITGNGLGTSVGTRSATVRDNIITGNGRGVSGSRGGSSLMLLINNLINENGSGFLSAIETQSIILVNNVITNNSFRGVDVDDPGNVTLVNNTITGNTNPGEGAGGVWISLREDTAQANLYNNIIWGNSAAVGVSDLQIENDWNLNFLPSPVNLFHNDIDQSETGTFIEIPFPIDPSNLDNVDPLFVNAGAGDYQLQAGSPVINVGDNNAPELPDTDQDGHSRIIGGVVDLGAFEFLDPASTPELIVASLSADPTAVVGGQIQVSATVENFGGAAAGGVFRLGFYISTDENINPDDHSTGSVCDFEDLEAGQTDSCEVSVNIPESLLPGTYYVGAIVDDLAQVMETVETNNSRVADTGPLLLLDVRRLYFAQFGNGAGLVSDIVLNNPSTGVSVEGSVDFLDDDGNPLVVGISGVGPLSDHLAPAQEGTSVDFSLLPLDAVTISTDGVGEPVVGSAVVSADGVLGGFVRFTIAGMGTVGVGASQPVTGFIVPVQRVAGGVNTGIAIHNTADVPVELTLTLNRSPGTEEVDSVTIPDFAPKGHLARFIDELFPSVDTSDFEGTLVVRAAGGQVAATALELGPEPGQFTTLPVTPLE